MKQELNEQTYVCSVVFLDIVKFSHESIAVQSAWRVELAALLDRGLEGMNPDNRIIVDSGDGAAIAFLLHPEEALSFVRYMSDELPRLRNFALRVGAHLGPLRVVPGMNGLPNPVGDGINAAQRVMSFADINEVLVSRAFCEAVIWLSPRDSILFSPYGKLADKHGREHDLFRIGSQPTPATPNVQTVGVAPSAPGKSSGFGIKVGMGAVLALLVGIGLWAVLSNRAPGQTTPSAAKPAEPGSATFAATPAKLTQPERARSAIPKKPEQTLSPAAKPAEPDSATLAAASAKPTQPERAHLAIPEKPRSTVIVASGKVASVKEEPHESSEICQDCSCADLMTKLSLGIPLDKKERLYMNERCKK